MSSSSSNPSDVVSQHRVSQIAVATRVNVVPAPLRSIEESLQPRLVRLLLALQKAQALTQNFAGVLLLPCLYQRSQELDLMLGQNDVPRSHGTNPSPGILCQRDEGS